MANDITCRDCVHAIWERTPTGRIKKGHAGRCGEEQKILAAFTHKLTPPCITAGSPTRSSIWPDYNASACHWREVAPKG